MCTAGLCSYRLVTNQGSIETPETLDCVAGDGSCAPASLVQPALTFHHDAILADATRRINEIVSSIPADRYGRQLSFLRTPYGIMLAWVDHKYTDSEFDTAVTDIFEMAPSLGLSVDEAELAVPVGANGG